MEDSSADKMVSRALRGALDRTCCAVAAVGTIGCTVATGTMRYVTGMPTGPFGLPLLIMIYTLALLPVAYAVPLLARKYTQHRRGEHTELLAFCCSWYWISAPVVLYALSAAAVEVILGTAVALWCGLQAVPLLGSLLYIFLSFLPTVLTMFMVALFLVHLVILPAIGIECGLATKRLPFLEAVESSCSVTSCWWTRAKLLGIGALPILLFYATAFSWTLPGLPRGVEFVAMLCRMGTFGAIAAPLLAFFVAMGVESARYVSWLSRRTGVKSTDDQ